MPKFLLEDKVKDLDCLSEKAYPVGFSFRRQDNSVQYFNLVFDGTSSIPAVRKYISIDESLHVTLNYSGYHLLYHSGSV